MEINVLPLFSFVLVLVSTATNVLSAQVTVNVDLHRSRNTISDRFIGVTIDSVQIQQSWVADSIKSQKALNVARALSPSFLRVGGSHADSLNYAFTHSGHSHNDLTAQQWDTINAFVKTIGWDFIFDLNALQRNHDGSWNPDNARELLKYSAAKNYTIAGFELGNEYENYPSNFHTTVTPEQLAKDTVVLQSVLKEFPHYYSSFIVGPESSAGYPGHFQGFLQAGGWKPIRAASFHHYYFGGSHHNLSLFTDLGKMNYFAQHLDSVFKQSGSVDPRLPVWVSETSSAFGGGVPNMSDRFVAGFLWLDKLGVCAVKGVESVHRQTFYDRNYSLVDKNFNPNPDFWLTVLYKRIIRGAVFDVTGRDDVRVYAACANTEHFPGGSLVVYMLNPNKSAVTFYLPQLEHQPRLRYSFTAGDHDGLLSKFISLNGHKLELVNDKVPDMKPEAAPLGLLTVPAYSYTFLVFTQAQVSICLH